MIMKEQFVKTQKNFKEMRLNSLTGWNYFFSPLIFLYLLKKKQVKFMDTHRFLNVKKKRLLKRNPE